MALAKGENSYVTVAEADAYLNERLGSEKWVASDVSTKEAALITATHILDSFNWIGESVSSEQFLAFPRYAEYFEPKAGTFVELDFSTVPDRIIKGCIELALNLLINPTLVNSTAQVSALSIKGISLTGIQTPSLLSGSVQRFINPLLENAGSHNWWRAN
jgi:hypothetical protein